MKFKSILLIATFIFFTSCSVLFPNQFTRSQTRIDYEYMTFNKLLDYNNTKYILAPTNFNTSELETGSNLPYVLSSFQSKLKDKVVLASKLKDSDGKLKIPFLFKYNLTDENIEFLNKTSDYEYLILTKIIYLKDFNKNMSQRDIDVKYGDAKTGAISYAKIIDVRNKETLLEMSCSGFSFNRERNDKIVANSHPSSIDLGEKTMKKLLEKIK